MMRKIILLAVALSLVFVAPAFAKRGDKEKARRERLRRTYTVGEYAYKKLSKSHELLGEDLYEEAKHVLDQLSRRRGLNPHERALLYQTYGYIASSTENYAEAARQFEACLAEDAMPKGAQLNTQYNLSQLYLATENFSKAVDTLKSWFEKAENPGAAAYYLLAVAYLQNEQKDLALEPSLKAIENAAKAKEPWLQLALSLRFGRGERKEVAKLLEQLVIRFPKKTYWTQLSGAYSEIGRDRDALAVMQVAYQQGFIDKDRELRNLAQHYLFHQIPYRAAMVLEKGMAEGTIERDTKSWNLLADAWLFARELERAIEPLENAARLSEKGELYVRLAQLYMEDESWKKAEAALKSALEKGELRNPGTTQLLLGISRYNQKRLAAAERAFKLAKKDKKTRKAAARWLTHIAKERDKG